MTAEAAPGPPAAAPWRLAAGGLLALAVAMGVGRFVYTPILPVMTAALGLSQAEAGLIASANFLGYLVGALAAAFLRFPGSQRGWLLAGLLASAATSGLMGLASTQVPFLALRFVSGFASAVVLVFASVLIADRLTRSGRADLATVHFAGVGVGIALSASLVTLLSALGVGWQSLWWAAGLLSLAALPAVARLVPPADLISAPDKRGAPLAIGGRLAALIAAYGLFGFGYVVTATFLIAIVRSTGEVSHLEPVVWLLVGLSAIPSIILWNRIGRRIGIHRAIALACLVEAAGVAFSVLSVHPAAILAAAVSLGGTFMGITALGLGAARALSKAAPQRVLAAMTAAFGLGQIVGPALAGISYDWTGSFVAASLAAAAALVAAAGLALVATPRALRGLSEPSGTPRPPGG